MRMYKEQFYLTAIIVVIALLTEWLKHEFGWKFHSLFTDAIGIDWDSSILAIIWFVGVVFIQIAKRGK